MNRLNGLLLALALLAPAVAADQAAPAALAARPAPTHKSLRENQPFVMPAPTEPEIYAGYPKAPPFTVATRQDHLTLYPCSQCHKVLPLNPQPRKLAGAPHPAALKHGGGRFWCLDCHQANDRDALHTINGTKLSFNESSQLCGQCHGARQRDWAFGAHGKRVAGWSGDRQLYACTHCHNPHLPQLLPRAPGKPPPVRAGLSVPQRAPAVKAAAHPKPE